MDTTENIYKISIKVSVKKISCSDITEILSSNGITPEDIVEEALPSGKVSFSVYKSSKAESVKCAKLLSRACPGIGKPEILSLQKHDWLTKWKDDYKPFHITKDILLVPEKAKSSVEPAKASSIFLDTDSVFGSGLHATTQMMAGFLREKKRSYKNILDIGTGTGILCLVALRYGATRTYGIDIAPEAVKTARRNLWLNKSNKKTGYKLKAIGIEKFCSREKFDFVAANLLTKDLIDNRKKIIGFIKPKKFLAVSGISCDNYPNFIKCFPEDQLRTLSVRIEKEWYAVLFQKK